MSFALSLGPSVTPTAGKQAASLLACAVALFTACGGTTFTGPNARSSDSTDAAATDAAATDAAATDAAATDAAATDAATTDDAATDAATTDDAATVDAGCPMDPGFACNAGTSYTCANNAPPNGLVCESVGGGLEGTSYCCLQSQNSCKSTGNGCPNGNVTVACTGSDTPFSLSNSIACSQMSGNRYCCSF